MWHEVKNKKDLTYELGKVKEKQLAIHFDGAFIVGVGAPIYMNGEIVASLGIYFPEVNLTIMCRSKFFGDK